jgi:predicted secreted Zn-dependent protease
MERTRSHKDLTWRTALSCESGACVQVAADQGSILIGSTRQPSGPMLEYTPAEWREFVAGIKRGDFDDLLKGLS